MVKKKSGPKFISKEKRKIIYKDDQQYYARIIQLLGNSRMQILLTNGIQTQGIIRGAHRGRGRGKPKYTKGDIIIVSPRDFDNEYDIIHKYSSDEARTLVKDDEIPSEFTQDLDFTGEINDMGIDFDIEDVLDNNEFTDPNDSSKKIVFDDI